MKKITLLLVAAALGLSLSACGGSSTSSSHTFQKEGVKVHLEEPDPEHLDRMVNA